MATATEQLQVMYPWIPPEVIAAYDEAFKGGAVDPWAIVREDKRYDTWFPGNKADDGSVRYGEGQYAAVRESYRDVMRSMNLSPDLFEDQFTALMEGEVSPAEFEARASEVYDRVISASDAIKREFAAANGFDITTEGILASALDPEVGDKILYQEISLAEVGGAGAEHGFTISREERDRLVDRGLTLEQARQLYGEASSLLPVLDVLAKRHDDPDDDFDLEEFTNAEVFSDPFQNRRMRRLIGQERSQFGTSPSVRSQRGAATGLLLE